MGDILDKETKLFLVVLGGVLVLMLFVYPRLGGELFKFNPVNLTAPTGTLSKISIDTKSFDDLFGLETDTPYLSPEPIRYKENNPENIKVIQQFIEYNII